MKKNISNNNNIYKLKHFIVIIENIKQSLYLCYYHVTLIKMMKLKQLFGMIINSKLNLFLWFFGLHTTVFLMNSPQIIGASKFNIGTLVSKVRKTLSQKTFFVSFIHAAVYATNLLNKYKIPHTRIQLQKNVMCFNKKVYLFTHPCATQTI